MKKIIRLIILIFFCINCVDLVQGQFFIPNPPKKIYPIQDYTGVLSKEQIEKLNRKLILYSKITSTEILVPIIHDLHEEEANFIAYKWGEKWKIGKFHKNNGIIILLSIHDRKISIQNGYGIEPNVTDFLTMKIINNIKPMLKNNLYYQAIDNGTQEIFQILKKNHIKKHNEKIFTSQNSLTNISIFLIMFFLFCFLSLIKTKNISLLNTFFLTNFLLKNKNFHNENEHDDHFDGFGGGGNFGGGGSSSSW